MSGEAIAIAGAAVGLLAVLVPLILTLHGRVVAEVASVRGEVVEVRRDLHAEATAIRADVHTEATAIRADVHALAERVARIEGAMSGPLASAGERHPGSGAQPGDGSMTTRVVSLDHGA